MPTTKDGTVFETLENKIATIIHRKSLHQRKQSFIQQK